MSIRTNQIKQNITPLSVGDQWLEENPHRKAENMTGQFVSDKAMAGTYRSPTHLFEKSKPKDELEPKPTKSVKKAASVAQPVAKTYTRQSSGQIEFSTNVAKYNKDLSTFETRLKNRELIKIDDFGNRSRQTIFKMIRQLRDAGLNVLTLSTSDKTAVGWILEDTLEGLKHG